ncbi:uncharacterized protein RAG0_16957 [Rhynchosporium agropyri]|uniref:Uncharacterized protein n=1 Tax=Rhynchosporium agropyri TaxID=914238 RepID=A0A1E1LSL6_9HELO|nr:uncharacterized protein RAG0_16957 [Rhynchosporium agropyri]
MFSTFPTTPRGRSRSSKVLLTPPGEKSAAVMSPATLTSRSLRTDLPPVSSDAVKAPVIIVRRPVGGDGLSGNTETENSAGTASTGSVSSKYSDSPGFSQSPSGSSAKEDSVSCVDSADRPMPQLSAEDKEQQNSDEEQQTKSHKLSSASISSFEAALNPTEIWRRRSESVAFPDLKLQKSNGSTASPLKRQEQPTDQPPLPKSTTGRKPVPARPAPPQPVFMGTKISKLRKKGSREDSSNNDGSNPAPAPPQPYSAHRLPTPEYLKADNQHVISPSILSPVSPVTPPDDKPPLVPRRSESRSLTTSNTSSDATIVSPTTCAPTPENDPPIRPHIPVAHSRDDSDTLTITAEAVIVRSPQPQKPHASARILTPELSSGKPSPMSLQSPATQAAYFPSIKSPATRGVVIPGPALDMSHFDCYQSHKFMRGANNMVCPVGCMICQRQDTDKRWRCTWCCLGVCASCSRLLDSVPGKDLQLALEKIGART